MRLSKIKLVSLIFLFFSATSLYGQGARELRTGITAHSGFLWGHSFNAMHLADQRPWGIELEAGIKKPGSSGWRQIYKNPLTGFSLQAFFLEPEKRLGSQYALTAFFQQEYPQKKKIGIFYRIGGGIGLATRTFDLHDNNTNNLISSHFNFALTGRTGFFIRIKHRLLFSAGLSLLHFSNGAYKMPNLGTNIPSIFLSVQPLHMRIGEPKFYWTPTDFSPQNFLEVSVKGGIKEDYPVNGPKFPVFVVTCLAGWQVNEKSSLNTGLDFQYDGSVKLAADTLGLGGGFNYTRTALTAGHELHIGKLGVLMQMGVYVYQKVKFYTPLYQRYGIKYYFSDKLFAQVTLKTHGGRADFVEWGVGIRLRKQQESEHEN